ncbi:MAG: single-strand DNA-binding protein [Saprospiraceae bacterium]|jgi:single-strand DNA-binding protein
MNALKNQVTLIGNIGKDVELRTVGDNRSLSTITLATNEYYKNNKGELIKETQWHNLKAWGKLADTMSNILSKGDEVMIQGKLTYRSFENKEGNKQYVTEIVVSEFLKMTKKAEIAA